MTDVSNTSDEHAHRHLAVARDRAREGETPDEIDAFDLTVATCRDLLASGVTSSVELTTFFLDRAERLNPRLNAYITIDRRGALMAADRADDERRAGRTRGPLHGIPIALKDLFDTAGLRTTAGARHFADRVPDDNAHVVSLLREAGVVILGKLNMHEWALGVTNVNPHYGPARNPWDTSRIPGGSSGGTGVSIAAAMAPAGTGTDTGGSIRIPAALCGVTGLKPTYGRCSLRGVVPLAWSLDHAGPMARTVEDCALLLTAMAGYDALDPGSADTPTDDYTEALARGVGGLKIGVARTHFFDDCDAEIAAAVEAAARVLENEGAIIDDVDVPLAGDAVGQNGTITIVDGAAYHRERLRDERAEFGDDVGGLLDIGASISATAYAEARRFQADFKRALETEVFSRVDLLLHPTTCEAATPIDAASNARMRLLRNTGMWNLAAAPVLALPCGFNSAGLPVGMSLVGAPWQEARLIAAGHAYQERTSWHRQRPPV